MRRVILPGDKLQILLAGAVTANELVASCDYEDGNTKQAKTTVTTTSGATAVDLIAPASPGVKQILNSLIVNNVDTVAATVTIRQVVSSTNFTVRKATLQPGDMMTIKPDGSMEVHNSAGGLVTNLGSTSVINDIIDLRSANIFDATTVTQLGTTPASADDFGITMGTLGTSDPTLRGADSKAASGSWNARFGYRLPSTYIPGQAITLRMVGGMVTTIANGTATLDAVVRRRGAPTVDICATNAQSVNTLADNTIDFTLTPTNCVAGDWLEMIITGAVTDSATGTAVILELRKLMIRPTVRSAA